MSSLVAGMINGKTICFVLFKPQTTVCYFGVKLYVY